MSARRLEGRRVLLTRPAEDAGQWAAEIAAHGAVPDLMPCVRIEPLTDAATRDRLGVALRAADCVVFTSARGVEAAASLAGAMVVCGVRESAVVGPATAAATARVLGVESYVARGGTSRALGDELVAAWGERAAGRRVVVVGAAGGRTDADDVLSAAGVIVSRVEVYRTLPAPPRQHRRDLGGDGVTDVLLASPSAVTGLLNQAIVARGVRLYAIGATTAGAIVAAALELTGQATTPDLNGLLEAMKCL
ncbi:MAG: uroporphyrinogen-III synthase [Gemmatimonadota bacterium]|nr:uroporphyrinogen-III synthase [Gemmatimonadota bacterium]